jgi:hypothetical protein
MEKLNVNKHWTSASIEDFTYRIASDFIAQVENHNEKTGTKRAELAIRLNRTLGRVSQLFNPSNITLSSGVRLGQASGMKVALVAYDDNDPHNENGPINSEIFYKCWTAMRCPKNFFELADQMEDIELCRWQYQAVTNGERYFPPISPYISAITSSGLREAIQ